MQRYKFFCDLEFTNLDPMRGQILVAAILVTDLNLNVINTFYAKVRPAIINNITWQQKAQNIHKITPEMAMKHPLSRREFCMALLNFLAPYYFECREPQEFVCHAMKNKFLDKKTKKWSWPYIDYFMLEWAYRYEDLYLSLIKIINIKNVISTMEMARTAGLYGINPATNRKSYKLNLLCPLVGFKLDHHEALSDAYGCHAIYKHCQNEELI